MNASKLFTAIATLAFAASAFAADVPAANATASTAAAAAAQVSVAAKSLNVPAVEFNKSANLTRAQVRKEAEEAARNHRSTDSVQFDFFSGK
ncbi:MAG: hypothetical protein V4484_04490 [Pseudomonadota bacterium]